MRQPFHVRLGVSDVHRTMRLVLGAVCFWLAALPTTSPVAWGWLAALLLVAWRAPWLGPQMKSASPLFAEQAAVGVAVLTTGAANSPLLAYLLAPILSLGFLHGKRAVIAGALLTEAIVLGGNAVRSGWEGGQELASWVALAFAAGTIGAWARKLKAEAAHPHQTEYRAARSLLRQLRDLSQRLPGSLDPAAVAQGLIDDCRERAPIGRAAVLTKYETEELVPLSLWGSSRIPWPEQLDRPSDLWKAVSTGLTVHRQPSLIFIALGSENRVTGVLVAEKAHAEGWQHEEIADLEATAAEHELRLETALLFSGLRHTATLEERERLAREMHNGVAQDLASFGFELDALRMMLKQESPALADDVAAMRGGLTRMIQDIRYSISDLRTTVGPERGLGAALSTHLQTVGSTGGVAVHLSLRESPLRLPADQEMNLFRVVQEFLTHARKHCGADNVWASLDTDPPEAALELAHDGTVDRKHDCRHLIRLQEHVRHLGAHLDWTARPGGGESTEIHLMKGTS